ncbi:uracil-DNA glycosylase [Olivibacter sp. SDN3]|uniref:uracil-DNA glycosylase n=1 Tax=Olivibacter sp. SDN3 TaxID=2764720 RepID=UPI001650F463|nr:uracil-DNA glycosylase [Olivibacter sp. SDN3]QNL49528.1 uracil-DNA glycosylase [Olivibacter sp. SDN3]
MSIAIEKSWKEVLAPEFTKPYMNNLRAFLKEEQRKHQVFPPNKLIFSSFEHTPFHEVKVVILGQDPYHNIGQAHGLSFSVQPGVAIPPSLRNMYRELTTDIEGFSIPSHGTLTKWADQGVLLLNAVLTVRAHVAASHQKQGWEMFTDTVIKELSRRRESIVFILWGSYARKKALLIDPSKHLIITSAHPSPLSAHNGFFGSKPFSKTNAYLIEKGKAPIDWQV